MSGVLNGDGTQPASLFGVQLPDTTKAPGSPPASGPAADAVDAGEITSPAMLWYPGARHATSTHGTTTPGQTAANQICPGPEGDYSDSGAGNGHVDAWARRPWQNP